MAKYKLADIASEFVTPKHSSAFGKLITGEQVEVGILNYRAGEGAKEHAHPHEQIIIVLKGRSEFTLAGETFQIGPGEAVHIPPNVPHSGRTIEDSEVVSCKSIVGGVGHKI